MAQNKFLDLAGLRTVAQKIQSSHLDPIAVEFTTSEPYDVVAEGGDSCQGCKAGQLFATLNNGQIAAVGPEGGEGQLDQRLTARFLGGELAWNRSLGQWICWNNGMAIPTPQQVASYLAADNPLRRLFVRHQALHSHEAETQSDTFARMRRRYDDQQRQPLVLQAIATFPVAGCTVANTGLPEGSLVLSLSGNIQTVTRVGAAAGMAVVDLQDRFKGGEPAYCVQEEAWLVYPPLDDDEAVSADPVEADDALVSRWLGTPARAAFKAALDLHRAAMRRAASALPAVRTERGYSLVANCSVVDRPNIYVCNPAVLTAKVYTPASGPEPDTATDKNFQVLVDGSVVTDGVAASNAGVFVAELCGLTDGHSLVTVRCAMEGASLRLDIPVV